MLSLSSTRYYANSVKTLLTGITRPFRTAAIFLGLPGTVPAELTLKRSGWRCMVRSAMDAWIVKETCLDEDYLWSSPAMGADWVVVDIGAGIGDFSVFAGKKCPDGIVFAYEPLADSFELLETNLSLNRLSNVRAFHAAVSPLPGLMEIARQTTGAAVSTRFRKTELLEGISAQGFRELLDQLPRGKCDFMKIDCEGCEFELLLTSSPALLTRIRRISLEFHLYAAEQTAQPLIEHLEGAGFHVAIRDNPVHSSLGFLYAEQINAASSGNDRA
jgi:FkbM family methyltransferase